MKDEPIEIFAKRAFQSYDRYRFPHFANRHFGPEHFHSIINAIVAGQLHDFSVTNVGSSFENRPLRLLKVGKGQISVLLWSQMHGDESTASMALVDMLQYLTATQEENSTLQLLSSLTLNLLPMLNPDGASRTQRRTAQNIDMNRDALALVTPEAKILEQVRKDTVPDFGFNLHDQELSTVGSSRELTAIALLAPAFDEQKSENEIRRNAKLLAATFVRAVDQFIPGKIARYDDTHEPRAFGDIMQQRGTSTVLIESGHVSGDPNKDFVRKLNVVGILSSLYAIATETYRRVEINSYERLPLNGKKAYDVIIRDIVIDYASGKEGRADLAISYQVDTHTEEIPRLVDIGDLHTFVGLREVEGNGKKISHSQLSIGQPFKWEQYF